MANSATLIDQVPIILGGRTYKVCEYQITLTANADLVIRTPQQVTDPNAINYPGYRVFVVGMLFAETNSGTVNFYSQSGNLPGTVTTTASSTAVTGVGTNFSKDFLSGGPPFSIVASAGDTVALTSVTDDLTLVTAAASNTGSGQTYKRRLQLIQLEFAANQPVYDKVGNGLYIMATWPGDSLIIASAVAVSASMKLSVIEALSLGTEG